MSRDVPHYRSARNCSVRFVAYGWISSVASVASCSASRLSRIPVFRPLAAAIALLAAVAAPLSHAQPSMSNAALAATAAATPSSGLNEQVLMIPAGFGAARIELETTVFKPEGAGPFPLLIMNHGKDLGNPHLQRRDRFIAVSREFVKRGYAVMIPMRKGFARSGGEYSDFGCNMDGNGQMQADDVENALNWARHQAWIDHDRIVVAGQSYGGLAAIAVGTRNLPGVRGLMNFAGGLRSESSECQWRNSLVEAFADYGAHSRIPSIWFYGANDSYFNHDLARRFVSAYTAAGGNAELVAYGSFKNDAHGMAGSHEGVKIWWPETEKFLRSIGMPVDQVYALVDDAPIPKSNYAALDNVEALPFVHDRGRQAYRTYLTKEAPKAFAVSTTGAWGWAEDGDDPVERVLTACQSTSHQPCRLYAVDNNVVWTDDAAMPRLTNVATENVDLPTAPLAVGPSSLEQSRGK
jgi:dienelactone hydrolase